MRRVMPLTALHRGLRASSPPAAVLPARRLIVVILLILSTTTLYAAAEKWYEAYARGVQAINAKNYQAAADALQKSISEMPNESQAARTRRDTIVYVPHFWLGIAKFNLGDVDGAIREWRTSEEQGVVQNTDYYARMREWVARAQAEKQRNAQNAVAEPRKAADAAVSQAMSRQMDALAAGGDRTDSYRAGKQKLQEAVEQFNSAGVDARAYKKAETTAGLARDLFATAAADAKKSKAARPTAPPVRVAQQPVQQPVPQQRPAAPPQQAAAQPVETPKPQPQAPPPQQAAAPAQQQPAVENEALVSARVSLQQFRARLATASDLRRGDSKYQKALRDAVRDATAIDRRLQKSQNAETIADAVEFVSTRQRELDALLAPPATAAPIGTVSVSGGGLDSAYRAFARGDFDTAERLLGDILDKRASAEGYLLRGCLRYTRATLSRSPKGGLDAAAGDFRAALKMNKSLRLEKSAFSPKLVSYFESIRAGVVR